MKRLFVKILSLVMVMATMFTSLVNVNASTPTQIYFESSKVFADRNGENSIVPKWKNPAGHVYSDVGASYKTARIGSEIIMAYCFNMENEAPDAGEKLTLRSLTDWEKKNEGAFIYILQNGYRAKNNKFGSDLANNDERYYATQLAIWRLQGDSPDKNVKGIKSFDELVVKPGKQEKIVAAANSLYKEALKHNGTVTPEISINGDSSMTLSSDKKYYQTNVFTIEGKGFESYKASLVNIAADMDAEILVISKNNAIKADSTVTVTEGEKFYIRIPADKVKKSLDFKVVVRTSSAQTRLSVYKSSKANKQDVGVPISNPIAVEDEIGVKLNYTAPTGKLIVKKVEKKADGTMPLLSDVTIKVTNSKGEEVGTWNTKDVNPKKFNNLPLGTYYIEEINAPAGYIKATKQEVTIEAGEIETVTLVNTKKTDISISKQDITNKEELPGAHLVIKDAEGNVVEEWDSTDTPHIVTKELKPGKYTLTETIAPEGYKLSTETITFTVDKNGEVEGTIVMYNAPKKEVVISKQDITNKEELPGAHLVIKDAEGNVVEEWDSTDTPHIVTKELKPGKYTLTETIAPEGYELSSETITFTVDENGEVKETVIMYNAPKKGVYISKQNITNKEELPGAHLVIKDANGKVVAEWVSSDKPHYVSLPAGKYTLTETIAPEGFLLSEETITFEIAADGRPTATVVMYNEPIPITGGSNATTLILTLVGTLGLGVLCFVKLRKQEA